MVEGEQTVICAWCGKVLSRGGGEVTHGICAACAEKVLAVIDDIGSKLGANLPPPPEPTRIAPDATEEGAA